MRAYEVLLEAMSWEDAAAIFKRHGVDPNSPNIKLHAAWRKLAMKTHPDTGGNSDEAALINAAYDVLKKSKKTSGSEYQNYGSYTAQSQPPEEEDAIWSYAGYSGGASNNAHIYRNNYTDMNFIKKRMWELSNHSTEEWTITGFDGSYSRATLTVYGSPKIFGDMAEAVHTWQTKGGNSYPCRAIYVQRRRSQEQVVYIIWADEVSYAENPIPLEFDSFNSNAGNDSSFYRRLTKKIDDLRDRRF